MDGKYDVVQAIEVADVSCHGEMDAREKKSEHLTTDNTGSGEVSGAKPTVTESQGMHLDLDPLEALCDSYRMDDEQYGASSLPSRLDLHYTVGIASDTCLILTRQRLVWQLQ